MLPLQRTFTEAPEPAARTQTLELGSGGTGMLTASRDLGPAIGGNRVASLRTRLRGPLKRGFDVVSCTLLLVWLLPVLLGITLLIRLDGGPALFAHWRIGRNGRAFPCFKFRSMVVDADAALAALLRDDPKAAEEWAAGRKLQRDPRVTRIGRILRSTSMDELPQLFNVLRGDMSLVGPRPVTHGEIETLYGPHASDYMTVRPGLTGLWQVSGRSVTSYDERVALDMVYINRPSLRADLRILLRTVRVVALRHGAY